jgi:hypothetical protein
MTRHNWIIVLIAAGVGLAILVGVLGTRNEPNSSTSTTKAAALNSFCNSLVELGASLQTLAGSSSKSEFQTNANAVQAAWDLVENAAHAVQGSAPAGPLDQAWSTFTNSVANAGSAGTVTEAANDIKQSASALVSTAKTTASSVHCT